MTIVLIVKSDFKYEEWLAAWNRPYPVATAAIAASRTATISV